MSKANAAPRTKGELRPGDEIVFTYRRWGEDAHDAGTYMGDLIKDAWFLLYQSQSDIDNGNRSINAVPWRHVTDFTAWPGGQGE